ncbi:MAG: DUF2813 domain-containing protein [Thermoflexia bacterium]|nr:MAG: DUF2813 domain-containing protein [Thermoflexia bacterium]
MIQTLEIRNFKSIRHLRLDCRRVNVFIGEPNTGKSNLLEAIGLFSLPYSYAANVRDFVRMEKVNQLFYEQVISVPVEIHATWNGSRYSLNIAFDETHYVLILQGPAQEMVFLASLDEDGKIAIRGEKRFRKTDRKQGPPVKFYRYRLTPGMAFQRRAETFLLPPWGENLPHVLSVHRALREWCGDLFHSFGLRLVLLPSSDQLQLQGEHERETFIAPFALPYTLASDTLQRLVFFFVAMESNRDSALVLEEPEVHAFPLYTKYLAERIGLDESNQYFLSTHNPHFLIPLAEKCLHRDLAVFVTYVREQQTRLHLLTDEELTELLDLGDSLFYNLDLLIELAEESQLTG